MFPESHPREATTRHRARSNRNAKTHRLTRKEATEIAETVCLETVKLDRGDRGN